MMILRCRETHYLMRKARRQEPDARDDHNAMQGAAGDLLGRHTDMSSDAQIRANRQNSQRSTGARTPEGKRRSARNAYKNGNRAAKEKLVCDKSLAYEMRI